MWRGVKIATILTGTAFAAQTASEFGSATEHIDLLAKGFIALLGVSGSITCALLVWAINRILDYNVRITKLETHWEDSVGSFHVHSRETDKIPESLAR